MLAQDMAPRVIMEIPGHSQNSITMNTDSHISEAQSRDAANCMGNLSKSRRSTRWLPLWLPMTSLRWASSGVLDGN